MMGSLSVAVTVAALAEVATAGLISWLRRDCPWLITSADLSPSIDQAGLKRFIDHGWDADLGWIRKPRTAHNEIGQGGRVTSYHIDANGARTSPGFEGRAADILAYGDSYTFARQVNDDEAWPHVLARDLDRCVDNRGVGNYGFDQALLRLEREFGTHPARIVIMGVVPETISRILCVWKHFSEYGNVFAFKPRFILDEAGALQVLPNPIRNQNDFNRIEQLLPQLAEHDYFYHRKFMADILRFPYLPSLWRTRGRNLPLMQAALLDKVKGDGKRAFTQVMERNVAIAAQLYRDQDAMRLLQSQVNRFKQFCFGKSAIPVLVIFPQLMDLAYLRTDRHFYRPLIEYASSIMPTIDLGPVLANEADDKLNYIDDRYGGHLSARGNRLVADTLRPVIKELLTDSTAGST